jgi:ankyrin repeat protein
VPFVRDGQAVAVRLERMAVPIAGPARVRPDRVPFPGIRDRASMIVRLSEWRRNFTLEIRGDGRVTFEGGGETALQGLHCSVISSRSIDALLREVERSGYFSMHEFNTLGNGARNKSELRIYVALDDHEKSVQTIYGNADDTPDALWDVADAILAAAQAARLIDGNRFTAPSLVAERWDFSRRDADNQMLLPRVARAGDLEAVRGLLAAGAPLHEKIEAQNFSLPFEFPRNWSRVNALESAAQRGAFDIVEALLETKTQWSAQTLGAARVWAIEHGNLDMAAHLLGRGADPLARTHTGKTALMAAAATGRPDLVGDMLAAGLDVHARDADKLTALHWAAAADYPRVVDSVYANRRKAIDRLVRANAEVDARGYMSWTPLIGNWQGLDDVTSALISYGADVNARDDDGNTPLMTNKSAGAVTRLLNAGADPHLRNKKGQNALAVARQDIFATNVVPVIERWMAAHPRPAGAAPRLR